MKNVISCVAIGVGALLSSGANAAPLQVSPSVLPDNGVENVRLVCDEYGRCYNTRRGRRVVVQEYGGSYGYAPRAGYVERRGYYDGYYGGGPSVGIGVGPGGVGFGVGVGPRW